MPGSRCNPATDQERQITAEGIHSWCLNLRKKNCSNVVWLGDTGHLERHHSLRKITKQFTIISHQLNHFKKCQSVCTCFSSKSVNKNTCNSLNYYKTLVSRKRRTDTRRPCPHQTHDETDGKMAKRYPNIAEPDPKPLRLRSAGIGATLKRPSTRPDSVLLLFFLW